MFRPEPDRTRRGLVLTTTQNNHQKSVHTFRKVRAEITVCDGASKGIDERMAQDVAVGVRIKANVGRNLDAAEHQPGHIVTRFINRAEPQIVAADLTGSRQSR